MDTEQVTSSRLPVALVVDDEPVLRMDAADMVAEEGFEVIEARTVDAAYEFLTQYPSLKLLLTDAETPGSMSGFDLAWQVAERWPHVCVVVASETPRPEDSDLPPTAIFVSKPLSADVVHEAIEEYCGNCDVR